ncbi:hypothetical protein Q8F55_005972 [Vanrija albida]|uniref:Protein CPL1-like domain-containing protein n=1 Tax=Vanrija albida TaxID=181172 RepID=A0ABR3Q447_9TREE
MTRDQRDIDAGGQQPADQTWDSCLALCADWVYTFFGWTDLSGCYCANHWPTSTSGDTTICGPRIFFPFKQDLPSGAPARRRRARAELQRQQVLASNPYCPVGSEACRVAPEAGVGYECLHTQDELESCGGCRYGVHGSAGNGTATGVDCTSIPGVKPGGVTCSRGECVVSACSKGFVRRGNSCV